MSSVLQFYPCFKINQFFQSIFYECSVKYVYIFLFSSFVRLNANRSIRSATKKKYILNIDETRILLTVQLPFTGYCNAKFVSLLRKLKDYLALKYRILFYIVTLHLSDQSFLPGKFNDSNIRII